MTKKINEDSIKQLNPQVKVLFQEYNIAFKNNMWASVIILSLTIIDNILNDIDNLDYVDGLEGAGFKFQNPNARRTCGCGESFSV